MQPISKEVVQKRINQLIGQAVYLHLETTQGVYQARQGEGPLASAYIRNVPICFERGEIKGEGPFRVGLKLAHGWVYCDGLTDWEPEEEPLLLAGHDREGRLVAALQLSRTPFPSPGQSLRKPPLFDKEAKR